MESASNIGNKKKQIIQYKSKDVKNKENNKNNLDDSELSKTNNDIMSKIDNEAKKLKINITEKDIKVFSKYEDLSEDQILNLIKEKNESLIKLSDQKDKTKKELNKIIKKLNTAIANNADLLCKEESDPDIIDELEKIIESKKKSLKISKNMNQNIKMQYNTMINKISGNNTGKDDKINEKETQLIGLKNENKNLELQIRKYKDDGVSKQKELEIICEDKLYPAKIKMKSDENQNLLNQKLEHHKKISSCMNSIKNLIKEVNHLEQMYSEMSNDGGLEKKINFWTDLIKSDLTGTENEIISRIEKNESKFINEIYKKPNNKNETNNKIRRTSPNLNEKRYVNRSLKKIKPVNNLEIEDTDNNNFNYDKEIINKGINSKLFYSQNTEKNILTDITQRYQKKSKNPPKGVFAKFSFLKQKPNTSESKAIKKIINNSAENIPEEIKVNIIEKDYNDTTDEDYRQLLDKKRQYLETNTRLEENIKKIQKTLNQKYNSVADVVQENTNRLDLLESRNELLQKEINNLTTVYQLTIEQERIKYELKQKENKIEKEKNNKIVNQFDTSSVTEKTILNALKESNDLPKKNKNKSGYVVEKRTENKVDNETREEKLQKIKLKYKNMDDEPIDESDLKEEIKE